jgi:hypothetical protein
MKLRISRSLQKAEQRFDYAQQLLTKLTA